VHGVFELARQEREEHGADLRSICFPLLGAGLGRMDPGLCIEWMWRAMESELRADPTWSVQFITWRTDETSLLLNRLEELRARGEA